MRIFFSLVRFFADLSNLIVRLLFSWRHLLDLFIDFIHSIFLPQLRRRKLFWEIAKGSSSNGTVALCKDNPTNLIFLFFYTLINQSSMINEISFGWMSKRILVRLKFSRQTNQCEHNLGLIHPNCMKG